MSLISISSHGTAIHIWQGHDASNMEFLKLSDPTSIQYQIRKHWMRPEQSYINHDSTLHTPAEALLSRFNLSNQWAANLGNHGTYCICHQLQDTHNHNVLWRETVVADARQVAWNKACPLQDQAVGVFKIKQNPFQLSSKFKISKRTKRKRKREVKGLVSGKKIDSILTCIC